MAYDIYFELIATGILPFAALSFYNFYIYRKIRESVNMKGRYIGKDVAGGGGIGGDRRGGDKMRNVQSSSSSCSARRC
jgi:hypothetical protein